MGRKNPQYRSRNKRQGQNNAQHRRNDRAQKGDTSMFQSETQRKQGNLSYHPSSQAASPVRQQQSVPGVLVATRREKKHKKWWECKPEEVDAIAHNIFGGLRYQVSDVIKTS